MKTFESISELFEALKKEDIGVVINDAIPYQTVIKNIDFILFKINNISLNGNNYYGDLVYCSYFEQKRRKKFTINIEKDQLIIWRNKKEEVNITSLIYDEFDKLKIYLLSENDNPEIIFTKAVNIGNTSENIINSISLLLRNTLSINI